MPLIDIVLTDEQLTQLADELLRAQRRTLAGAAVARDVAGS